MAHVLVKFLFKMVRIVFWPLMFYFSERIFVGTSDWVSRVLLTCSRLGLVLGVRRAVILGSPGESSLICLIA